MKKYIPAILVVLLAIASCKKEQPNIVEHPTAGITLLDPNDNYPQPDIYDADGYFYFTGYNTIFSQDQQGTDAYFQGSYKGSDKCITIMEGTGYDKDSNWVASLEEVPCKSYLFRHSFYDVYGVDVIFTAGRSNPDAYVKEKMYMPEKLRLTSPAAANQMTISPGQVISWNTDTNNPKEDVLEINYDPLYDMNKGLAATDNTYSVIRKYKISNNLGTYTLKKSDFEDIPAGTYVNISVIRYNSKLHYDTYNNGRYVFVTGNTVTFVAKVVK